MALAHVDPKSDLLIPADNGILDVAAAQQIVFAANRPVQSQCVGMPSDFGELLQGVQAKRHQYLQKSLSYCSIDSSDDVYVHAHRCPNSH
jgi:hypothetical protein